MHWTQTREGRKRVSEAQKLRWAKLREQLQMTSNSNANVLDLRVGQAGKNGAAPPAGELDEPTLMGKIIELYSKLTESGKNYVRSRLG